MSRVLTDMYSIFTLNRYMPFKIDSISNGAIQSLLPTIQNLIINEKLVIDERSLRHWVGHDIDIYLDAFEFLPESSDNPLIDDCLLEIRDENESPQGGRSVKNIFDRALVYMDMARQLGIHYSPHPARLKMIFDKSHQKFGHTEELVIMMFERKIQSSPLYELLEINPTIPPVVEYVLDFSKQNDLSLMDGIFEIRNSDNAKRFRSYFSTLITGQIDLTKRVSFGELQVLEQEVHSAATDWVTDLNEHKLYETRNVSLRAIKYIGPLLGMVGSGTIKIKSRILKHKYPHLLFLNDVYNYR